jgi:hypothetical protein
MGLKLELFKLIAGTSMIIISYQLGQSFIEKRFIKSVGKRHFSKYTDKI